MRDGRLGDVRVWLPFDTAPIVAHRRPYARARLKGAAASVPVRDDSLEYASILNQAVFPCADEFHRVAMVIHDVDPCTLAFRPNRRAFVLRTELGTSRHVPDLRVVFASGERAYVSLRAAADPERFGRVLPAITDACRRQGAEHIVLDEAVALESAYGRNCLLIRSAGDLLDDEMVVAVAATLDRVGLPARLGDLSEAGWQINGDVGVVGLAAFRIVAMALGTPIGPSTMVHRGARW